MSDLLKMLTLYWFVDGLNACYDSPIRQLSCTTFIPITGF